MSDTPNIVIRRKHQSAPKSHWLQGEVEKAAEEIDKGNYIAAPLTEEEKVSQGLGLALGAGIGPDADVCARARMEDIQRTRDLDELGRHPRVAEALERLKREAEESDDPIRAAEAAAMLHETHEEMTAKNRWDGQGRWMGRENEEMRIGKVLGPAEFYEQLCMTIGRERVILSQYRVRTDAEAASGRVALYVKNPLWKGNLTTQMALPQQKAQELQREAEEMLVRGQKYRKLGWDTKADKTMKEAGMMFAEALELCEAVTQFEQTLPKELLRVGVLQHPLGTEWMLMNFDEFGVPTTPRFLGWRTALLTMVRARAITEAEAMQAFPVGSGPAADWFLQQLYWRRNRPEVVQ